MTETRRVAFCIWAAIGLLTMRAAGASATPAMSVEVYRGDFATVNSFIFSNTHSLIVMDVQRTSAEARKLAGVIESKHLPLAAILITHGHTDHFTGMAVLKAAFPAARILVCSEAIKRDIKDYAIYMNRGGATGGEPALDPALRPKPENPEGFDYEHSIHVLRSNILRVPGGGTLRLTCDYPPSEAPHMTTVYSPELDALFAADLCYNGVHAWMGDDIDDERIATWRRELVKLGAKYAGLHPKVYCGHGEPSDIGVVERMTRYIDDFVRITSEARSRDEAWYSMQALYPTYKEAGFLLKYSIERHVR